MDEYVVGYTDDLDPTHVRERIVRCRDCAYYWGEDPLGNRDACTQDIVRSPFPRRVRPDGFCSWAKPREEA